MPRTVLGLAGWSEAAPVDKDILTALSGCSFVLVIH